MQPNLRGGGFDRRPLGRILVAMLRRLPCSAVKLRLCCVCCVTGAASDLRIRQFGFDELDRHSAVIDDGNTEIVERLVRTEDNHMALDRHLELVDLL